MLMVFSMSQSANETCDVHILPKFPARQSVFLPILEELQTTSGIALIEFWILPF